MTVPQQRVSSVVVVVTSYESLEDAIAQAPDMVAAHIARSQELPARGTLLLSGAFLNNPREPLSAMAIHTTPEAAEEYAKGDPLVQNGLVGTWYIRAWANRFASPTRSASNAALQHLKVREVQFSDLLPIIIAPVRKQ